MLVGVLPVVLPGDGLVGRRWAVGRRSVVVCAHVVRVLWLWIVDVGLRGACGLWSRGSGCQGRGGVIILGGGHDEL